MRKKEDSVFSQLPERIEGRSLPQVDIVDMKKEEGLLSERVRAALQKNIEEKKQSLLFLNRRGFANFILCPDCGFTFKCPNCSVTLTHHFKDRSLQCHYCDYRIEAPGDCPKCRGYRLRGIGIGTERLEQEIQTLFPEAQVERMDRDTTSRKHSHQQILKRLEAGHTDILVGTQMIVKGHDFPNVTFVGVVSADTSLHFPDFRSSERTFQLLTQVAGRAGRGETIGEVSSRPSIRTTTVSSGQRIMISSGFTAKRFDSERPWIILLFPASSISESSETAKRGQRRLQKRWDRSGNPS